MILYTQQPFFKKSLILFVTLIIGFTMIYVSWYYIILKPFSTSSFKYLFSDIIYWSSVFKIVIEIITVSALLFGLFLYLEIKISWTRVLYLVIIAEFVFLVQAICEFLILLPNNNDSHNLELYSLSIYRIVNPKQSLIYFNYILQTANLWEVTYIFILGILLKNSLGTSIIKSVGLVFLAYGVPLILWMIFATFIQISNS